MLECAGSFGSLERAEPRNIRYPPCPGYRVWQQRVTTKTCTRTWRANSSSLSVLEEGMERFLGGLKSRASYRHSSAITGSSHLLQFPSTFRSIGDSQCKS